MMRAVLLVALLATSSVAAQVMVLEDDENDTTASLAGLAPAPGGTYPSSFADLHSLTITESPDAFRLDLALGDLDPDLQIEGDLTVYNVDFNHVDAAYRLTFLRQVLGGGASYGAQLMHYDSGRQQYVFYFNDGDLDIDTGSATLGYTIPRDVLLDGNGTAPTLGRELTLFRSFARSSTLGIDGLSPVRVDDAMPNDGFGLNYAIQQGLQQSGHARLWSDNPVRASNGEQATFLYYVHAENLSPDDDRFDLSVQGAPADWTVTLPASTIRIDGNGTQRFPVLVSTPFSHSHGDFEDFVLTLTSHSDSRSIGRLQMGIRYLEIPQPAGHHDKLWIHARAAPTSGFFDAVIGASDSVAYMNALQDDERSESEREVAPSGFDSSANGNAYEWTIFLEPGLQLGLDFDLSRTGVFDIDFTSDLPMDGAVLNGRLSHYEDARVEFNGIDGKETVLGDLAGTTPKQLNGPTSFSTIFTPTTQSDLIPYSQDAALVLHLRMEVSGAPVIFGAEASMPRLVPGGELKLPLFEYRDPVEDVFNDLAGIDLEVAGKAEKYVNPGETVLMNLTLTNSGAVDDVFTLRVNGTNQEWAQLIGDTEVFIPTGASRPVVVAVSPPGAALDGDVADLIVTAASAAEPTITGQARVVAIVDDLLDRDDEGHLVEGLAKELSTDKQSPGPALPLLALALLALVRRAQRS